MYKPIRIITLAAVLFFTQTLHAQTAKEQAVAKAREAIRIEDGEGKYDEAIKLLAEAAALDPDNIDYPYEIAYAYAAKKDYKTSTGLLEKLLDHKDVNGRVYQSLGNNYDYMGQPDKAIETYERGVKKFPNAGELYLELGNMRLVKKEYDKALGYYERGIENDPKFPSNYYWAARIYCNSEEEVWGMLYGEIFMNLERNSKRTSEISRLLFDTYKSEITIKPDSTSYGVSFSKNATMSVGMDELKDPKKFKLPFGMGCYEILMAIGLAGERRIDLDALDRIRTRFLDAYFQGTYAKTYPNALFDYQNRIKAAGQLEAYNHWLLSQGDKDAFIKWQSGNESKWKAFLQWYGDNALVLDATHNFHRTQY